MFCSRDDRPLIHTFGWAIVVTMSFFAAGYLLKINVEVSERQVSLNLNFAYYIWLHTDLCWFCMYLFQEFSNATVSHNLHSPTVALDEVYFPSIVICNANTLRR